MKFTLRCCVLIAVTLLPFERMPSLRADQISRLIDEAWLNSSSSSSGQTILYHYHPVMVDDTGAIVPWFSPNLGRAFDDALHRTWKWFAQRPAETERRIAGQKHNMFHQVWTDAHDLRGIGGDQVAQFLSSLDLFYNYTGDPAVLAEMRYQADYYLAHSLSPTNCLWPNLPFPYNTENPGDVHKPLYDGDMILGLNYTQPDKAGSFAWELIKLYKKTAEPRYRDAAVAIANTLAAKVQPGDADHSPLPFKVHVLTGEVGSAYTTNYTGTLEMFRALIELGLGDSKSYTIAITRLSDWLKTYPATNQKWGPFFEDVAGWSETQINGITYARYLLEHPEFDPNWRTTVSSIFDWAHTKLGNAEFKNFQVHVINEQTSYPVPGQSHSARQAAAEIYYWSLTGDDSRLRNALRMLSWATYSIDSNGANRYPRDAIWYSDGYGDFWRHILRAMASAPQLAPDDANHLLESSSVITHIHYTPNLIRYATYDPSAVEILRLTSKPVSITAGSMQLGETPTKQSEGWMWQALPQGGILRIRHAVSQEVSITLAPFRAAGLTHEANDLSSPKN